MTEKDYCEKILEIRVLMNELANDLNAIYSTRKSILNNIYNDVLNRDFSDEIHKYFK